MPYYVCKGAKLKCSMGSDQSALEVVHLEKPVRICGQNMAGIMDHKPMANIKPFGQCKSLANPVVASATAANYGRLQEMPCVPNTMSPWLNGKMNFLVKGQPALLDCSKCLCLWAGVIEITDAGQKLMSCGIGGPASQETGAGTAGADSAAAVSSGNGLASQGAGTGAAGAGNAAQLGIAASGSQASQGAGAGAGAGKNSAGRFLIKKVEGKSEASLGDGVKYRVTHYSIGENIFSTDILSPAHKLLSQEENDRIRWAEKIGSGGIKELVNDKNEKLKGFEITKRIDSSLAGGTILVMACVEGFNEKVSQKTAVRDITPSELIDAGLEPYAYSTLQEAGYHAVKSINPRSIHEGVEYSGTIYAIGGKFYNTYPIKGTVDRAWSVPTSKKGRLVGWFHTHGDEDPEYKSEEFSDMDMHSSYTHEIPGFLGTPLDTNVLLYEPPPFSPSHTYNNGADNRNYYDFLEDEGTLHFLP